MSKDPTSCRKATSSFVDDDNSSTTKHMQVTPRFNTFVVDQCDAFPVSSLVSNYNLIGDSVLIPEGSRAVSVSKTGERHSMQLDKDVEKSVRNGQFFTTSGKGDSFNNSTLSSPHQRLTELTASTHPNENYLNTKKRSKSARRHAIQNARLICTPRRAGASHSMHRLRQSCPTNNMNVETQTNLHLDIIPPRQIKSLNATNLPRNVSTPTLSLYSPTNSQNKNSSSMQQCQQVSHQLERIQMPIPTKLYTKSSYFMENYSELRRFISFLSLVTVMSWFISTYFEIEILSELIDNFFQRVRNWCLGNAKPKTKMEIFMEFLTDLCT